MYLDYFPDGLTESLVDVLIAETLERVEPVGQVPPLFADRDAEIRRERRRASRAAARVVRVLPLVARVAAAVESEAA
ncbi:hypothetical protein [Actinokineospora iranica]|uniref:Uncharacterized protein n=1 Tax=Actinokineospora iranica TaxID=1271860 RepID=A0A1G6WRT7_9PSEU|nr:hypothetical protein [Actinokineospora iranica]SDD68509.1 hypothetical protein SAMN05216174_115140 [Actinokineospora iranica]